jgi:hypothetical protein
VVIPNIKQYTPAGATHCQGAQIFPVWAMKASSVSRIARGRAMAMSANWLKCSIVSHTVSSASPMAALAELRASVMCLKSGPGLASKRGGPHQWASVQFPGPRVVDVVEQEYAHQPCGITVVGEVMMADWIAE